MNTPSRETGSVMAGWWRHAAIYQVYLRSFADGDGDGVGDLTGLLDRLPYLRDLGVDALWITPWYVSPMADGGYDVADYRDIDPVFGTLVAADAVLARAHELGLRVIVDIVPNHCSSAHPWFQEALASAAGSVQRQRFCFADGTGEHGELPPNGWRSTFGGPAWSQVADGQWYLHLFDPGQPDFNWHNGEVRAEFEDILRFWLDRGVDGFRIDVADALIKPDLTDPGTTLPNPDEDGVHEIYRSWRKIVNSYPGERILVGEVWVPDAERFANYLRADELHGVFNFPFLRSPWDCDNLRSVIERTIESHASVSASPTWVLSNHDVPRVVTRFGRADTAFRPGAVRPHGIPADLELGYWRARAAALLMTALPGGVYVYQGEELGLAEVEDLPDELRQDPTWRLSEQTDRGRDGCRVPLPWDGEAPPFGFSTSGKAWLPQPATWARLTAAVEGVDPHAMLSLYRSALRLRPRGDAFSWLPTGSEQLAFSRNDSFTCMTNFGDNPVELPDHRELLLASRPLESGKLPPDTTAWLRATG